MSKKISSISLKRFCLFFFALLMSAAFIIGPGVTSVRAAKKTATQKAVVGLIDINSATQKELETLPGVGAATARKIIGGRPYKSVDELSKTGLSAKVFDKIKALVTVGGATAAAATDSKPLKKGKTTAKSAVAKLVPGIKINVNTADKATLEMLPKIGAVKAQAIIDGRPYESVEDIMKIRGIKQKTFDAIKEYIIVR